MLSRNIAYTLAVVITIIAIPSLLFAQERAPAVFTGVAYIDQVQLGSYPDPGTYITAYFEGTEIEIGSTTINSDGK